MRPAKRAQCECVGLSVTAARSDAWLTGVQAGCERLVHPGVTDRAERARQRRFIGVSLAAPFVLAPALVHSFSDTLATPTLIAVICVAFALAWTCASTVAVSGRRKLLEKVALLAAASTVAVSVAAGGGAAAPTVLLAGALAFEPFWIDGRKSRLVAGAVTAALVLPLAVAGSGYFAANGPQPWLWAWFAPLLYLMATAPRMIATLRRIGEDSRTVDADDVAAMFGAAALRLSPSGEVLDASGKAGELLGMQAQLLIGRRFLDRVHVADRVQYMQALASVSADGTRRSAELRIWVADGPAGEEGFVPILMDLALHGETGEVQALLRNNSMVADMRAELESRREAADSMDVAKNRFLAAVSHELRTPLNAIIGFSDMMLNDMAGNLEDRQREYVGLISSSGRHLLSVVNAILEVSRIESGAYTISPEPFPLAEAVELCTSMMKHQAQAQGLTLTVTVRPGVNEVVADRRAVQQIIINLLSNAIKFTPAAGSVSLEVSRLGGRISIVVADTGIGIAPEDIRRLGKPFTQISNDITRRFEGAGLGLSLVKGLVALHEGGLEIESAPGKGTTVTATLPMDGPKGALQPLVPTAQSTATVHRIDSREGHETIRKTA